MKLNKKYVLVIFACLLCFVCRAEFSKSFWKQYFKNGVTTRLIEATQKDKSDIIYEVLDKDNAVIGWVYKTDEVSPKIKGMRGEISMVVAIGTDKKIIGVHTVKQREDRKWFKRIKKSFYKQFEGVQAGDDTVIVDTVTGATVSSSAMVEDVLKSAGKIVSMPEVKSKLK